MRSLIALVLLSAPALAAPAPEMRGLWVVRTALLSPRSVDQVVDQAQEGGFNALFVQVRGRGDAFYASRIVSRSVLIERQPPEFDPLARLLERAHARGLQVHAWVNVLLTAHFGQPLPDVIARHPEWLMVPRSAARSALSAAPRALPRIVRQASRGDAEVEGYYLSPSATGVAEHLEEVVREIARGYPVEGLHLDFIRYPGPEYDYSRAALEGFRRSSSGGDLLAGPTTEPDAWSDYRRSALTSLAERLSRAARTERSGIVVSAAVVPDEALAVHHKYQDWPGWLARGILDAVCPMAYTPDSRIFRQQVDGVRSRVRVGQALWAGVGAYRLPVADVIEKIGLARASGAAGVVLFSHESFSPSDLKRLRREAFLAAPVGAAGGSGTLGANPR